MKLRGDLAAWILAAGLAACGVGDSGSADDGGGAGDGGGPGAPAKPGGGGEDGQGGAGGGGGGDWGGGAGGEGGGFSGSADAGAPGDWEGGGGAGGGEGSGVEGPDESAPPPDPEKPEVACGGDRTTTLFLSADDSNSQASPVLVRRAIRQGRFVPERAIRTYEFLNYADFDYPAPAEGVAVHPQMRAIDEARFALQIGVRAADLASRRPLNLVLVLDASGSMAGPPMALLRESVQALAEHLGTDDRVSVVRLDAAPDVMVDGAAAPDLSLDALFAQLVPSGATNVEAALRLAYERATAHRRPGDLSRVVLLTDGGANAGETAVELIARHAGGAEEDGIYLVGAGLGEGFNDTLLDAVTDAGKGAYFYVDSPEEARRMFGERFAQNFEVAALNVQVELELPPRFGLLKFHGEQVATVPGVVRPQNLAPGDQMVFHQILGTCADAPAEDETFAVRVHATDARTGERRTTERAFTLAEVLAAPAAELALGDALVAFAEGIRTLSGLTTARDSEVEAECARIRAAIEMPALAEARDLLDAYCDIVAHGERHDDACDCEGQPTFTEALGLCGGEAMRAAAPRGSFGAHGTLGDSAAVRPREGCRFAALSTGTVGEAVTLPGTDRGCNGGEGFGDPLGDRDGSLVCDLAQVSVTLTAPRDAHSFSFDFDFFSAEFPDYIGSEFNDTFYAIIEAESTEGGRPTNISFDGNGRPIEINNNYFANPFHPCSERDTGFVRGASTCWLRTSWPIRPGETFKLTFSVHDEGDGIYTSTVLLDNFRFHPDPAVGMTDPLN